MAKKYQDVYCQLKADIYTKYPLGSFLPPELELMQIYNTSRTTIRRAVSILRDEHILDVRQGRGTQVLLENYSYQKDPPFFHNVSSIESNYLIEQKDNQFKIEGCIVDIVPATKDISNHLNIPMGTLVYRLERIQVLNDIPYAFIKNYIRCDLTAGAGTIFRPKRQDRQFVSSDAGEIWRCFRHRQGKHFHAAMQFVRFQNTGHKTRHAAAVFTANRFHHDARGHGICRKADSSGHPQF